MNEITFKQRAERLFEVNKIIGQLDSTIRPAAFLLLEDYVVGDEKAHKNERNVGPNAATGHGEVDESFFLKFNHDKPSDNALLVSAYHYANYGSASFSSDEIKKIADQVGITLPERPDMTFKSAQRDGKNLFCVAERGQYRPTVHGETFFRTTYDVPKGKKQKPVEQPLNT